MEKVYLISIEAIEPGTVNKGDTIVFDMPPFCSGNYEAEVKEDDRGLYIDEDDAYFEGCRNWAVRKKKKLQIFTPEFLKEIGFTFVETASTKSRPDIYGCAKDKIGLTHLYWNNEGAGVTYFGDKLDPNTYLTIKKDAETRTVFNGYVFTQDDVRQLLKLTL
jgi:hypothetical protein